MCGSCYVGWHKECSCMQAIAICICCSCLLVVALTAVTFHVSDQDWDVSNLVYDKCTPPIIVNGLFIESGEWSDDDTLDEAKIRCNQGYHRTTMMAFSCSCQDDGEPCRIITNACVANGCTVPDVEYGWYDPTGWIDHRDGNSLDQDKVNCHEGWNRTSTNNFICVCEENQISCGDLSNACEEIAGREQSIISNNDNHQNENGVDSSSAGDIPAVYLVLLVLADVIALCILAVAFWLAYDYRDRKRAENYFKAFHLSKASVAPEKHLPMPVPVATPVSGNAGISVPPHAASSPSRMIADGNLAAQQAEALDSAGRHGDAIRMYELAIFKFTAAIEDMPVTDESYNAVNNVERYKKRVCVLKLELQKTRRK